MAKANIMIVEDEAIIAKEIKNSLKGMGYAVTSVVSSGEQAIEKAEQGCPDLILMNIQLKGKMDGLEAAEIIRSRLETPVIFLTAYAGDEHLEKASLTMPFGYIRKPFQDIDLKVTIDMAFHRAKIDAERKREKVILKNSYDIISKSQAVAFLWKNDEGWPVEFVSDNVKAIFGNTAEEFMSGKVTYSKVLHPDDVDRVAQEVANFSEEKGREKFTHEPYRIVNNDKNIRWIEDKTYIVKDEKGKITHYQGIVEDITSRIEAEQALEEAYAELEQRVEERSAELLKANEELKSEIVGRKRSEQLLRNSEISLAEAQRIAHLGNWDWDIGNNELLWSDEVYRISGLSPQEFEASYEGFLNCVHPDDLEFVKKSMNKALKEKIPFEIDHRIVFPTGEERIVHERAEVIYDEADRPIRMIGTVQDVTEYKKKDEILRKRNNEMRLLNKLIHQITISLSLDSVVESALEEMVEIIHPDLAMIFHCEGDRLILLGVSPDNYGIGPNEMPEHKVSECLCGLAISEGKPQYSDFIHIDPRCAREECKKAGFNSFAALPLQVADSIIGVLGLASFEERDFSGQAAFLETIAGQIAIGMQNALLYDKVRLQSGELELQVKERTAQLTAANEQLQGEIRERKQIEERLEHINAVLVAIRNVNQLITRENDRDRLIKGICENLTETRGYHNAWIILLDEKGVLVTCAESGLGKKFQLLVEQLKHCKLNDCSQRALSQPGVVVTEYPVACADCPLSVNYTGRGGMTARLEYSGKVYGLVCASVPSCFINDEQEQILFEEVAGDIGFALRSINLEKKRKRTDRELQRYRDQLEDMVKSRTSELVVKNQQLRYEIAERKRADEQILRSKTILQSVFDAISEPLIMLDKGMKIGMLNRCATKYYGLDFQEIIGKQCHQAFKGRSNPCEGCNVPSTFLTDRLVNFERRGFMDNDRYEDVTAFPLPRNQKLPINVVLRISDVTEKKKIQHQMIRADRLLSLGQLSGGIAHEIRNPLAGISLFVDILTDKEKFDRTAKEIEILDEIRDNIDKIDGIIRRILDFAKPTITKAKREIDLNRLIREEIKLWSMRTRRAEIDINLALEESLPQVSCDPIELRQVIVNLIQNAIEAMGKKKVLHIISRKGLSFLHKARQMVIIEIKDSGPGIDPNHKESIFNPFFTTKASGTGLGLAISHQIIERHNGIISCESEPGKGTTFTIELPCMSAK